MGEVTTCGLCGAPYLVPLLDLGVQPLAERYGDGPAYPLRLVRCRSCTLVQLDYIVPQGELFPADHLYATGNTAAMRKHFAELAALIALDTSPDDVIVDIGANDGTLLRALGGRGTLIAVEPTAQARKIPAPVTVYEKFFTAGLASQIRDEHGPAAVIIACNVLAHVGWPHDFMSGVALLLRDNGVFITENHDLSSVTDDMQIDTVYHEHLRYYDLVTLGRLLAGHGLAVCHSKRIDVHGGSFRVRATRGTVQDLQVRADAAALQLRGLLRSLTAGGAAVYGVGATTRATPLIHFTGIAPYISCVCELLGSQKIGHMIPGTAIPIVDEAKLIADQPAYALLFSWHIAGDIMRSLRRAGYTGKFIVPLPAPRIVDG